MKEPGREKRVGILEGRKAPLSVGSFATTQRRSLHRSRIVGVTEVSTIRDSGLVESFQGIRIPEWAT